MTDMTSWQHIIRTIGNVMIPPQCPSCHQVVSSDGICGECWSRLKAITTPACVQCGRGFDFDAGVSRCGQCLTQPPDFDRSIAAIRYNAMSKRLILGLKYAGRHDMTPILGRMMANQGASLLHQADWIVPLPLHWTRHFTRGYNQSAELARAAIKAAGVSPKTYRPDLIRRSKRTENQGHKTRQQRRQNMRGAFRLHADNTCVKGATILIIDDVLTTGASLSSVARCLKAGGAKEVAVLVVARVG